MSDTVAVLTMVTVRQMAACIGVEGSPLSMRTIFGNAASPLSALSFIVQTMQKKIDLNIILVGWEAFFVFGQFEIESAVAGVRTLYAQIDLGIGELAYFGIPLDDADGHEHIDSDDEPAALQQEWGFAGKAIDVFFVLTWAGLVVGRSPRPGPCPEHDEPESGLVVAIEEPTSVTANALAHEIGHYLGLGHVADTDNLMFKKVPNGERLTSEQGLEMRNHCMVYTGCRFLPR